jgi:prepilin-type N-terminal cleavage/methylation domain-containing protein
LTARSDGYTLIEVIVAVAIFTMMAALSVAALDQGLRQYRKLLHEGTDFWKYAGSLWINKSFSGMFENVITNNGSQVPYFECGQDMISYASVSPLAGSTPVVVWLVREGGNVVYYELPLNARGEKSLSEDYLLRNYASGNRMVILEGAENVVFGCKALDTETMISSWREIYSGRSGGRLPEAVRILYTRNGMPGMMYFSVFANSFDYASYNFAI